ncbi:MAG: hypothetical protein EBS39_03830 [Gammaproteobacteria bacterium]|nr:hypothetical protein [Gammaproteobacteria bacterium]
MPAKKPASPRSLKSDLRKFDAAPIKRAHYRELPDLTDEMIARGEVRRPGRPRSRNPRVLLTIRIPADVLARWKATGPGWQTRMAERLSR